MSNPVVDQTGGGLMQEDQSYTLPVTVTHRTFGTKVRKTKSKVQVGKGLNRKKKSISKPKATTKKTSRKGAVTKKRKKPATKTKACKPKKKVTKRKKTKKGCK